MSEFKGTKGKWVKHSNYIDKIKSEDGINICDCWGMIPKRFPNELEMKANALLISKAPEMLEMLEVAQKLICSMKLSMWIHPDCSMDSEFYDICTTGQETENKINELIKSATEL